MVCRAVRWCAALSQHTRYEMVRRTDWIKGSSGELLDPRITAYRSQDGIASKELEGIVDAEFYTEPELYQVTSTSVALRQDPTHESERISTALHGEWVKIFERINGWAWVQLVRDDHVGYVEMPGNLSRELTWPTHFITVPVAPVLTGPDVEFGERGILTFGALVTVDGEDGNFVHVAGLGWITVFDIEAIGYPDPTNDWVGRGKLFEHREYVWGNLDCSRFVQLLLNAHGMWCPRDTDLIAAYLDHVGATLVPHTKEERRLLRGDIVIWKSHIGVMVDSVNIMHCCPLRRRVVVENLVQYEANRFKRKQQRILGIRRLP